MIKDIHIHKRDNLIDLHFEFTNGWHEVRSFRLNDNQHDIAAGLHYLAARIGKSNHIETEKTNKAAPVNISIREAALKQIGILAQTILKPSAKYNVDQTVYLKEVIRQQQLHAQDIIDFIERWVELP